MGVPVEIEHMSCLKLINCNSPKIDPIFNTIFCPDYKC
jgi:hypothetical protein